MIAGTRGWGFAVPLVIALALVVLAPRIASFSEGTGAPWRTQVYGTAVFVAGAAILMLGFLAETRSERRARTSNARERTGADAEHAFVFASVKMWGLVLIVASFFV